ncbi:MAG: DUF120 domain-containing protein [Deltaproteobacteria bacterium]|nr:DUF120 domain-containing protein [Deltaproteobacteria bacterium]
MNLKLTGTVFSDLGRASVFMALDWVQQALLQTLGYAPFPATLNLRPRTEDDALIWQRAQKEITGVELPTEAGACSAQIFLVDITRPVLMGNRSVRGAILLPAVSDYPADKIEVVAPVRLKDKFRVNDGDQLTLEFVQ